MIIPRTKPKDSWKVGNTPPNIVEEKAKERARKIARGKKWQKEYSQTDRQI